MISSDNLSNEPFTQSSSPAVATNGDETHAVDSADAGDIGNDNSDGSNDSSSGDSGGWDSGGGGWSM